MRVPNDPFVDNVSPDDFYSGEEGKQGGEVLRLTVTELNRRVRNLIEESFPPLYVEGEISNLVRHSSGHWYFSLKDDSAVVRCVIFKWHTVQQPQPIEDGMKVLAYGNLTVYEKGGQYQLQVLKLRPLGLGDLQRAFEALKAKLYAEGLFDEERKRPIPLFPETIGVVTSPTGAAIQDIVNVVGRRFPSVRIILRPTLVQGDDAAADIVQAIEDLNEYKDVDLLIVGRGGGSLEDLWAFNAEIVARAIVHSKIPVISAVGHEIDFTISDFAADHRAPTPSAAAEIAVSDAEEILIRIRGYAQVMRHHILNTLERMDETVQHLSKNFVFRRFEQFIGERIQRIDELHAQLAVYANGMLRLSESELKGLKGRLGALNPVGILERGYSITRRRKDRKVLLHADEVVRGDELSIQLARGRLLAQVEGAE